MVGVSNWGDPWYATSFHPTSSARMNTMCGACFKFAPCVPDVDKARQTQYVLTKLLRLLLRILWNTKAGCSFRWHLLLLFKVCFLNKPATGNVVARSFLFYWFCSVTTTDLYYFCSTSEYASHRHRFERLLTYSYLVTVDRDYSRRKHFASEAWQRDPRKKTYN